MTEEHTVQHLADKVRRLVRGQTHSGLERAEADLIAQGASPAQAEEEAARAFDFAMRQFDGEAPRLTGEIRAFVHEAASRR
ncbi:MAG: hypothetical protein K0S56_1436 [Microvirga sp.]|jgi:hypothetical protein|nr:hypothetical protein [Microvirga sp.]